MTDSEGHPWFPKKSRPSGDLGGPFYTRKVRVTDASHLHLNVINDSSTRKESTNAYILPSPNDNIVDANGNLRTSAFPDYSSSDEELEALGSTAVSLCNPVNPVFDASTAFAELFRDGLPTISGLQFLKERSASSVGSEFLNYQFGILPIIGDVKDLAKSIKTREAVLKQLRRDSGRLVRRSFEFPIEREVVQESTSSGSVQTNLDTTFFKSTPLGIRSKQVRITRKRWFAGAFTYHLPDSSEFGGFSRMALEAEKLFGVIPDPADLWNLIPFSWTVDWFVNVGPILSNLSNLAKYGLVMPYGYMMENTIVEYSYTLNAPSLKLGKPGPYTLVISDETKKRVKASPFGFGVTWDSFDTTQVAILAALGLSKSPF